MQGQKILSAHVAQDVGAPEVVADLTLAGP